MKHTLLLFILICSFLSALTAQNISVEPNPAYAEADLDDFSTHPEDLIAEALVSNNTSDTLFLKWERVVEDTPDGWITSVCDPNICVLPQTSSQEFILYPNVSELQLLVHAYPTGNLGGIFEDDVYPGEGEVHLKITNLNDPSDTLIAVYLFTLTGNPILDLTELELLKLNIVPNPASEYFSITNSEEIESVFIYDILGNRVKIFEIIDNIENYNIADLPNGCYFVSLINKDQRILKTLRLEKH